MTRIPENSPSTPPFFPPPLSKGDTVGIVAPGGAAEHDPLNRAIRRIRRRGFRVRRPDHLLTETGFTAGDRATRRRAFRKLVESPDVDALLCARGGQGSIQLLRSLMLDLDGVSPKRLVGYSDITALQLALLAEHGWVSFSGPMVSTELGTNTLSTTAEEQFWHTLTSPIDEWTMNLRESEQPDVWTKGSARGPVFGGCLSLVSALVGTPYMPDPEGDLLLLEDVDEAPYRIDRMVYQLRYAGIFERINGLLLGQFPGCDAPGTDTSGRLNEVLRHAAEDVDGPVLADLPYGHRTESFRTIPFGAVLRMETEPPFLTVPE